MNSEKPTQEEQRNGFRECKECGGILMLEAGFEVSTTPCAQCFQHVASREEFFSVGGEILSK